MDAPALLDIVNEIAKQVSEKLLRLRKANALELPLRLVRMTYHMAYIRCMVLALYKMSSMLITIRFFDLTHLCFFCNFHM